MSYSLGCRRARSCYEPPPASPRMPPAAPRTRSPKSCAGCYRAPSPEPPLGVDADLRPEGRQGPLVRSLAAYERYYADWSKIWEAQALLASRGSSPATRRSAHASWRSADRVRYPGRRTDRRTDHRDPPDQGAGRHRAAARGADPATHAKLGRGGLADVEWAVQLLQLRPRPRHRRHCARLGTLDALAARPRRRAGVQYGRRLRWPGVGCWRRTCATR